MSHIARAGILVGLRWSRGLIGIIGTYKWANVSAPIRRNLCEGSRENLPDPGVGLEASGSGARVVPSAPRDELTLSEGTSPMEPGGKLGRMEWGKRRF